MARKRTSDFEKLIQALAKLPWWLSLLVGFIAWLILHNVANSPQAPITATALEDMSGILLSQLWRTFATFGQYLIPIACVLGAAGSIIARHKRKKLLADVNTATQPGKAIDGMSWQQFEQLIGEAFRQKGYKVTETGGKGADGGIDLILHKNGEKYLVQCKHWRALKVGVPVVREFFGAMAAEGAVGGYIVTSGHFTAEAKQFAQGRNIELVDGNALKSLLATAKPPTPASEPLVTAVPTLDPITAEPSCPLCQSAMGIRVAKKGANAGNQFWGCSTYPQCRGVVNV